MIMMDLRFLLGLFVVVAMACLGNASYFTCTEDQWQAQVHNVGGSTRGITDIKSEVYYDATNLRRADYVTGSVDNVKSLLRYYTIYTSNTNGTYYIYDVIFDKCTKIPSKSPFLKQCLPVTSRSITSKVIGPKNNGLNVSEYRFTLPNKEITDLIVMTKAKVYIPVQHIVELKGQIASVATYFNVEAKAPDASYFTLPKKCTEGAVETEFPKHLNEENIHHQVWRL